MHKNFGFTLVETLIVIGIAGVLLYALINIFIGYNNYLAYMQASIDVPQSASSVIDAVKKAVWEADQVVLSRSFSGTLYTTGANSLVLELPSMDSSGNILAGKHDYIVFYIAGNSIYSLTDADVSSARASVSKALSSTATSLVFTYDNADATLAQKVDINIQGSEQIKDKIVQSNLHQQAYFRNK